MDWDKDLPPYYDDVILPSNLNIEADALQNSLKTKVREDSACLVAEDMACSPESNKQLEAMGSSEMMEPEDICLVPENITCSPSSDDGDTENNVKGRKIIQEKEENLKCITCGFKAKSIIGLRLHYFNRHQLRHTCQFCGEPFCKLRDLHSHIRLHHSKEEKLMCPHCDYGTHLQKNLKHHITLVHKQVHKFQCTNCDYSTGSSDKFKTHLGTHYIKGQDNFRHCNYCSFATKYLQVLKHHIRVEHENKKEYRCHFCVFKTIHVRSLKRHLRERHKQQKFYDCQFTATQSENFKCHMVGNHKITAASMESNYSTTLIDPGDSTLQKSSNDKNIAVNPDNSINNTKSSLETKNMDIKGILTNETITSKANTKTVRVRINKHKLKEWLCSLPFLEFYNDQTDKIDLGHLKESVPEVILKPKSNICQYENFSSNSIENIKNKAELREPNQTKSEIVCPKCHFACTDQTILAHHKKVFHDNFKSYECPFCDFGTVYTKSIIQHVIEQHSKKEQHQCPICLYSTAQLDYMLRHVQKHFTCKNIQLQAKNEHTKTTLHCQVCSFTTTNRYNLENHFQIHGKALGMPSEEVKPIIKKKKKRKQKSVQPIICHLCGFEGQNNRDLKTHIKTIHEDLTEYSCPMCSFSTVHISSLKLHIMSRHTQERPYLCSKCPFAAVQFANLKVHIKRRHKPEKEKNYKI